MTPLAIFVSVLFLYSLLSQRLDRTVVTAPIVFTVAGMLMFRLAPEVMRAGVNAQVFLRLAEVGLVLLLFTDARRTDLKVLRNIGNLPARLLSTGMLLTMLLGTIAARLVFPQLSLWEAAILSAILAPTDAGLGQVIVSSSRVPVRIRQALNVEAGLNDGLSVPFLLFFMAIAAVRTEGGAASLTQFILEQLGLGVLIGAGIGLLGGWCLSLARRRRWMADSFLPIGIVALPVLCLVTSEMVGASMFIASFVAGLAVQIGLKEAAKHSVRVCRGLGTIIQSLRVLPLRHDRRAELATVRSVGMALRGHKPDVGANAAGGGGACRDASESRQHDFYGLVWSARSGLYRSGVGLPGAGNESARRGHDSGGSDGTVLLSVFAHGLSAMPGISLYARKVAALGSAAPEHQEV